LLREHHKLKTHVVHVIKVSRDLLGQLVPMERMALTGQQAKMGRMAKMVLVVMPIRVVYQLVSNVHQESQVMLVVQDQRDQKDHREVLDWTRMVVLVVQMARQDLLEIQEQRAPLVKREHLVLKGKRYNAMHRQDLQESWENQERKDQRDRKVEMGSLDQMVAMGRQAMRVMQVRVANQDQMGLLDQRARVAQMAHAIIVHQPELLLVIRLYVNPSRDLTAIAKRSILFRISSNIKSCKYNKDDAYEHNIVTKL
jgi:hypothetical protein